ncbi:hypothetical protein L596_020709 [Steinernema carpocapsae]|uniref:7TM GPCR serpentine receptor class x (Srx) domain-containing protein n=1 Tax=Steinernema carpocapsae TaxID=34508 RepID=A0A4U5MUC3_STECR|nr:hypothetical protein L596_020709 [Steinernema carpocapsae]
MFGIGILISNGHLEFVELVILPYFCWTWQVMLAISFALAVNRVKVMCDLPLPKHTATVLVVLAWLFGSFFFVSYVTRFCPLIVINGVSLWIDITVPYANTVSDIELYSSIVLICSCLLIYIGIILFLLYHRFKTTVTHQPAERKLLFVAFLEFLSCILIDISWHFIDYFQPDPVWSGIGMNMMLIFHCGWINPGLNLLLSSKLRNSVLPMFSRSAVQVTVG